ncbi:Transposase domain (DUF772) [uncultured Eubacterium sp.]|nr:Transposase domain (DUF772) [uncultured Eubacterium sp.]
MTKHNILRKQYTLNERNYQLKIPMELDACIPEDDCVRLISQFVEELDLAALYGTYERTDISSRTIEKNCRRDINYMYLLEGRKAPDHASIARFRTKHFAKCAQGLLAQMTGFLYGLGQVTDAEVHVDGTKIEASANRYTFVWKKSTTKHQAGFLQKTALLVGDIIGRYGFGPLWHREVKTCAAVGTTCMRKASFLQWPITSGGCTAGYRMTGWTCICMN